MRKRLGSCPRSLIRHLRPVKASVASGEKANFKSYWFQWEISNDLLNGPGPKKLRRTKTDVGR
jgi:hypothetical protein